MKISYLRTTVNNKLKHKFVQSARSRITRTDTEDYGGSFTKQHIHTLKVTLVLADEKELIVLMDRVRPQSATVECYLHVKPPIELIQLNPMSRIGSVCRRHCGTQVHV